MCGCVTARMFVVSWVIPYVNSLLTKQENLWIQHKSNHSGISNVKHTQSYLDKNVFRKRLGKMVALHLTEYYNRAKSRFVQVYIGGFSQVSGRLLIGFYIRKQESISKKCTIIYSSPFTQLSRISARNVGAA